MTAQNIELARRTTRDLRSMFAVFDVALERRWGMVWTFRDGRVVRAEA